MSEEILDAPQPSEAEVKAKQLGWVDKDDFKGDLEQWKDAETFLRRGEEVLGFVRKDLDKATAKNAKYEAELAEIRETVAKFSEYHKTTADREYKRAIEDLRKEKVIAIEQGDGERVIEIEDRIDAVKDAQKTTEPAPKAPTPVVLYTPEVFQAWGVKNEWYGTDKEMSQFAEDIVDVLLVREPELKGEAFLEKVSKKVKAAFPEKFENPNRENSPVSGTSSTRPSGSGKKKSYENLPAEAKAACDRFVKQKLMTRDQYVSEYDWE
jgi:hypothetical protein